jgi:hypothetical protein
MTLNMENDNVGIVYALEKIISYARYNQYICLAQRVWWISSIVGLQSGLFNHIENFKEQTNSAGLKMSDTPWDGIRQLDNDLKVLEPTHPARASHICDRIATGSTSGDCLSESSDDDIQNQVVENCEAFFAQSKLGWKQIARKNLLVSKVVKWKAKKPINIWHSDQGH